MFVGAVFFPLLGASISGFFGRWIGDKPAQWSSVLCMVLAAICAAMSCRRVPGRSRSVSTIAPIMATSRTMPAVWNSSTLSV